VEEKAKIDNKNKTHMAEKMTEKDDQDYSKMPNLHSSPKFDSDNQINTNMSFSQNNDINY